MSGNQHEGRESQLATAATLIVIGVMSLVIQAFRVPLGRYMWPFAVIIPGAALLLSGLWLRSRASEGLAVAGSIVTIAGLVLFTQNLTGLWATWAYAWALVAPGGVGVAQMLYGIVSDSSDKIESGRETLRVALWMFAVGFVFFELIIGVSGFGLNRRFWPMMLIVIGAGLLVRNLIRPYRNSDRRSGEE